MKFTKIKHRILRKKFDKKTAKYTGNKNVSTKKILSIGILTTEEIASKLAIKTEIEKVLNKRDAKMYSYRMFNKSDDVSFKHFSENDLNWNGEFTEVSFKSFLEQPFDLLIGYFNEPNLYLEKAIFQSKATFKVGFADVNPNLYQIEIAENILDITQYTTELKKYLQSLNKI